MTTYERNTMFKKKIFGYAIPITKSNADYLSLLNNGEIVVMDDMIDTILVVPHDPSKHNEILEARDFDVMYRWEETPSAFYMTLIRKK